jgi:hypothetical protein
MKEKRTSTAVEEAKSFAHQSTNQREEGRIMKTMKKALTASVAAALVAASLPPIAQGRDARGMIHLKGTVVCGQCDLDEVRSHQANQEQLYQFTHAQGSLVMRVRSVNDSPTWRYFGWPSEIPVRADNDVFRKLTAEENLFKDVEINGALSATRALDIFDVAIKG